MDLFEDPLHNAKREKNRQQEMSRRTRSHARTLLARIFHGPNGVLLVRGEPDPERLFELLAQADSPKPPGQASPAELGFPNSDIIPLNRGGLTSRARSVQLWRTWIEKRMAGHTTPVILRKLREEWQNLQSLGDRVAALHGLVGQPSAARSPFWLEPGDAQQFQELINRRFAGLHAPDHVTELARFICWTAGPAQAERFVESVRPGLPTTAQQQEMQSIERFRQALNEILKLQQKYHDEVKSRHQAQVDAALRHFLDNGPYQKLYSAWEKIPAQIRQDLCLYPDKANLDIEELARRSESLITTVTKKCTNQMPKAEFAEAFKAAETYRLIVKNARQQLKDLNEEKEAQLRAAIILLRDETREMGLFDKLRERFQALPQWARAAGCIQLQARDRDIRPNVIAKQVEAAMKRLPQGPSQKSLGWLALFCLTDNSQVAIGLEAFELHYEGWYSFVELWRNRTSPGYETVLEHLKDIPTKWELEHARQFLATGGSVDDLIWIKTENIWTSYNVCHGAAIAPFRAVIHSLRSHGAEFQEDEIDDFWAAVGSEPGCALLESLARFMAHLPEPSRQQVGELMGLVRTLSNPLLTKPLIDRLRAWANPPARPRLPAGCPENLPDEITLEARRLAYYQRMAGQAARIPGSIRDILEARSRQITELDHLKQLGPQATSAQKLRLENLSRRVGESHEFDTRTKQRMLRQIREVTVLTALSAAKEICRTEISRCWMTLVGFEPDCKTLQWQDHWLLLGWIQKLDADSLAFVQSILKAHQQHGPAWRQALPHNKTWLDEAGQKIELESWLNPPVVTIEIGGKKLLLKAAVHPIDIFLMGSRFNTCVSLHDGANRDTVIANAADANKAIIYAWQANGTPLARMLVGVRSDWKMVHFQLYASDHHDELNPAFARYCGTWAAKAGLGLASSGAPQVLSRRFWYDDSSQDWGETTITAYREIKPNVEISIGERDVNKLEQLQKALELVRQNRPEATAELGRLGESRPVYALFWAIRGGLDYSDRTYFSIKWDTFIRELGYHLSAAGLTVPKPREVLMSIDDHDFYWSELTWTMPAMMPPDRESIGKTIDFLLQLPANPDSSHFSSCFATCRISPAFGSLPFRRLVQLLRRYADFYIIDNCGCDATAWRTWAQALRLSWLRRPDPGAFADVFMDDSEAISQVMQLFCRICPDRRFSGAIRRQMRTTTEADRQAMLHELRGLNAQAAAENEDESSEQNLYRIVFDRELDFQHRLEATVALIDTTEKPDAALGALLCIEWTFEEREKLPLETRRAFAEEMLRQGQFDEWKTWPLVYWMASMPEEDQYELLTKTNIRWISIFTTWAENYDTMGTNVVTHALEHPDERVRRAAEMIFRVCMKLKPGQMQYLLNDVGGWIWPETFQKLRRALKQT